MKTKKIVITVVSCVLVAVLLGSLGIYLVKNNRDPVPVYQIEACGLNTMYMGDSSSTQGLVSTDQMQTVYLSSTQEVTSVKVQQGQRVEKGQVLITFDTTLSELSLERQRLDVEKSKMRLLDAQQQLKEIKKMKPISYPNPKPTTKPTTKPTKPGIPDGNLEGKDFLVLKEGGSSGKPAVIWMKEKLSFTNDLIEKIYSELNCTGADAFVVFEVRKGDQAAGEVTNRIGVQFTKMAAPSPRPAPETEEPEPKEETEPSETTAPSETTEPTEPVQPTNPTDPTDSTDPTQVTDPTDATDPTQPTNPTDPTDPTEPPVTKHTYSFRFFQAPDPDKIPEPDPEPDDGPDIDMGSGYTAAEIAQMRAEKEKEIKELQFSIKMAEAEYKIMQKEFDTGEVVSEVTGYVMSVLSPEEAKAQNQPIVKVSAGGNFQIQGVVSELKRDSLQIGQEVQITSWDTGDMYTGSITEIGDYPVTDQFYFDGNPNSSNYPFTVAVSDSANLQAGSYVEMNYATGGETEEFVYLDSAFVRTENGKYFVYVKNSEGLLEKRPIQVAGTIYEGSYTAVSGGLSVSDSIAFPYGRDVKDGAKTKDSTAEELYSNLY